MKNWMKCISDSENIKNINIPGAHDSATQFCQFSLFSRCQNLSINEMLDIGVRVFDLRVDGENMVHSFTKCRKSRFGKTLTIYDVTDNFYTFLNNNPSETVIIIFKDDAKTSPDVCLDILKKIINKNTEKWYLENNFPTLSEVRGKIILLNRIDSSIGIDFSKMPYQGGNKDTFPEDFSPNTLDTVTVQDRYILPRKIKWIKSVKPILENERRHQNNLIINYLSSAGMPFIPKINSSYVNRKFMDFKLKPKGNYGIIMSDFLDNELTGKIIKSNFYREENYED